MKQVRLVRPGSVDGLDVVEVPVPEPGPGEALVRIRAASLNYRDSMTVKGSYAGPARAGLVPLSDGAGEIAGLGPGAARFAVGDRVCPTFCPDWIAGALTEAVTARALGGTLDGVLSEYVAVPESALVAIPDHLSFAEAATLPCAAVTAWHALTAVGQVVAGDTVLVQGTGGVSVFALQFAKAMGARVIGTSSSDAKLERARGLGLDEAVNYRTTPEWHEAALALTGGVGVDHVVEVGGAGTLARSIQAARMGGSVAVIGVLTGRSELDPTAILRRRVALRGIYVGSRAMFEAMNRAVALHRIRPVIDREFGLDDARAAWRTLEGAGHFGKIVVTI